jgi:hypothetical protein
MKTFHWLKKNYISPLFHFEPFFDLAIREQLDCPGRSARCGLRAGVASWLFNSAPQLSRTTVNNQAHCKAKTVTAAATTDAYLQSMETVKAAQF